MNNEELWYWYCLVEKYKTCGVTRSQFAKKHQVSEKKLCNMINRLRYNSENSPDLYAKSIAIGRMYLASSESVKDFASNNNVSESFINHIAIHIRYIDKIEKLKKEKGANIMNFIKVPMQALDSDSIDTDKGKDTVSESLSVVKPTPMQEIVEKKNDIEIIISKGVKVLISPNIDSMKIIKIIELLKDL